MTLPGTILDPWNNLCLDPRQPSYKQAGGDNIPNGGDGDVASIDIVVERRLQSPAKGAKQPATR